MVLSGVQNRLAELRSNLFPQRLYLQVQDQALTALVMKGATPLWCEALPLADGLLSEGEPLLTEAVGDLLGDWLVERGYGNARLKLVLPYGATALRLVEWPGGQTPEDPLPLLQQRADELALPWRVDDPAEPGALQVQPLASSSSRSLVMAVRPALLEAWIDVIALAGVALDGIEAAPLCLWRGLSDLVDLSVDQGSALLLHLTASRSWLLALEEGEPHGLWSLPPASEPAALMEALLQWQIVRPLLRNSPQAHLWIVGDASVDPDAPLDWQAMANALACKGQWLDVRQQLGWSVGSIPPDCADLALLWGLHRSEVRS